MVTNIELEYDKAQAIVEVANEKDVRDPTVCFAFPYLPKDYLVIPISMKTVVSYNRALSGRSIEKFCINWTRLTILIEFGPNLW